MRKNVNTVNLTDELLKKLKTEDFIAITLAEGGAMGDPGAIEIVDKDLKFYYTHFGEINDKILEDKIPFLKTVQIRFDGVTGFGDDWDYLYTGFGNHLFVKSEYKEPILKFIDEECKDDGKDIPKAAKLYTHWYEALKEIAGTKNGQIRR